MELSFELIREAGLRVPSPIGPTIGIIGALIIGQSAVEAGIVSPILIIIVAITGITSFAIPDYYLAFHCRIWRFVYIIFGYLATFIPFVGWIVCLGISIYQCNSLAKAFGKDVGYTIGLLLVPTIFYMILGFGNAQYVGPGNVTTSSTTYQGDGVVNISEKPQDESTTNNDEDNANL